MTGNTADILSPEYMQQILSGLSGGTPEDPIFGPDEVTIITAVLEHYDEIFTRTSELSDCLNRQVEFRYF